jgi:hypothetical protein
MRKVFEPPFMVKPHIAVTPFLAIHQFLIACKVWEIVKPIITSGPDVARVSPVIICFRIRREMNSSTTSLAGMGLVYPCKQPPEMSSVRIEVLPPPTISVIYIIENAFSTMAKVF